MARADDDDTTDARITDFYAMTEGGGLRKLHRASRALVALQDLSCSTGCVENPAVTVDKEGLSELFNMIKRDIDDAMDEVVRVDLIPGVNGHLGPLPAPARRTRGLKLSLVA